MKTPVAMPTWVRVIATVLVGLPAGLMWLGGLLTTTLSTVLLFTVTPDERLTGMKLFGGSVAAIFFGYPMVATISWFNGAHHYRMPGRRLPAYIAMEIVDQWVATISVGLFLVSVTSLVTREPAGPAIWLVATMLGFTTLGFTIRARNRLGAAWRDEPLSSPEGARPLY